MAKGKSAKTAEKKARTLAKQTKKVSKGEKKAKSKTQADVDSDAEGDVDLDAILATLAAEQAQFLKVTETPCDPPSPRSSATLLASPANRNELFLFGGEFFDGSTARFYSDLFVYHVERRAWRVVRSPNSPLPRSGHAWCRGGNSAVIFLFGGEFSSPKQGTFHHYNDFWSLDPGSREWTRIESKKGPSARSGHRMVGFKQFVVLFGGFQDTAQSTKYLQDVWVYDCQAFVWHEIKFPAGSRKPDPRSSCSFLPRETGAVLYGGYSRVKVAAGKGGAARSILRPLVHQDTWLLEVLAVAGGGATGPPVVLWKQRKKPANQPNPMRAGATMAYHKGRGILFGGVHDVEESEEGIESEFFNDLFVWNCDRNRFFPLALRRPKARKVPVRKRENADEELLRNLAALEATGSLATESETDQLPVPAEADAEPAKPLVTRFEFPHGRFNAQLTVQDDTLFIFGGTFERGDKEFTFNDMYSIDLGRLDGVQEIYYEEPRNWGDLESDSEGDMSIDEDDDENDVDEGDEETLQAEPVMETEPETPAEAVETAEAPTSAKDDARPFPRPFESLRDFFARSTNDWQTLVADQGSALAVSVKELRTKAFRLADERWWDCREEVRALEDEQEEAGIGEVIALGDREGDGRRR